jgi:23S rRNA pseudouridine1911/1915/1917 synthase
LTEKEFSFLVKPGQEGRLDKVLVELLPELTRSRIQTLIKNEKVKVNQTPVTKTGWQIYGGDRLSVAIPEKSNIGLVAEEIPLEILFENDDLAVINKPAGMVVHPAAGHSSGTMVNAALAKFYDLDGIGGELRPGIVHRLDKDTSGIIVIAKNDKALTELQDQFRDRKVSKIYLALVDGKPPTPTGRVEAAIARDPSHRKKMAVVSPEKGRHAESEYRTIESFPQHTLLEVHPITGRTHQIRLHMAFLKCPIVGDQVYGHARKTIEINRHFLHAARLKITIPGEKTPRTFEAPLPVELDEILTQLRKK